MPQDSILMGVIGRPHGVRGLVHVTSYTEDPADLARYAPLADESGRAWSLAWREAGIAELRDAAGARVADRDAAARLTNLRLYAPRERLPAPAEDEFYLADLIGLTARGPDGAALGQVRSVHDYGAGASLEIVDEAGGTMLLPFVRAVVPRVDLAAGAIDVVPPMEVVGEAPEGARTAGGEA